MTRVSTLALALCAAGCAPAVTFVPSGLPFASHAHLEPDEILTLDEDAPLPPFTDLGYLEVDQTFSRGPSDATGFVEALAREAAAHGCNAIVVHTGCTRRVDARFGLESRYARRSATCVWLGSR
jgi:hypothetical protein